MICTGRSLEEVPEFFPLMTKEIDLRDNLLKIVHSDQFSKYEKLENLDLSGNLIHEFCVSYKNILVSY